MRNISPWYDIIMFGSEKKIDAFLDKNSTNSEENEVVKERVIARKQISQTM